MPEAPAQQRPDQRSPRLALWLLLATLLLAIGLALYATFGPNPPIVVGKATTHITTPLTPEGLPDYAAALRADLRKGVTPENNGAIPFLETMWPADDDEFNAILPEDARLLCQELGMPGPPPVEGRLTPLDTLENRLAVVRLLRKRLPKPEPSEPGEEELKGFEDFDMNSTTDEEFFSAPEAEAVEDERVGSFLVGGCDPVERPWTADDLPFLAEWIEANKEPIDRIVDAAKKPRWYLPSADWIRGGSGATQDINSDRLQLLRSAARLLLTRSYYYEGRGDLDAAARDLFAIMGLARHARSGPYLIDHLVADSIAYPALYRLNKLNSGSQDASAALRRILTGFDRQTPPPGRANVVDLGERYLALDYIVSCWRRGVGRPPEGFEPDPALSYDYSFISAEVDAVLNRTSVDWNKTLTDYNRHRDDVVAALKLPTWRRQHDALVAIDARYYARTPSESLSDNLTRLATPHGRAALVADAVLSQCSGFQHVLKATPDCRVQWQLTRVALAVAIHRAENGAYPESLDALVPDLLPAAPVDLYHQNPLGYRRTDNGFLLYSFGPNGVDDGGSQEEGYGMSVFEGRRVDAEYDGTTEQVTEKDKAANDLLDQIPEGADDPSLRVPLPVAPWPWEDL